MIEVNTTEDETIRQAFEIGTRCHATRALKQMLSQRKTKYLTLFEFEAWAKGCPWTNNNAGDLLDELFTDYFWEGTDLERRTRMNQIMAAFRVDLPVKAIGRITKLRIFLIFY